MKKELYFVVKDYDSTLAKRQPWYSVKKFTDDMISNGYTVKIVSDTASVPTNFKGVVVKLFSFMDAVFRAKKTYTLVYFVTFPVYQKTKFLKFQFKVTFDNFKNLGRVLAFSLLPDFLKRNILSHADVVIVTSDRAEKYLKNILNVEKYIPFISNNWDKTSVHKKERDFKTIGYFGPPFTTRCFDQVIDFFCWIEESGFNYQKKLITRLEREELKSIEQKYLTKLKGSATTTVVSGFLNRKDLITELSQIDVVILPFKVVMSELPVVVLEALELGISVITTEDSGIAEVTVDQKNILMLDNINTENYSKMKDFIDNGEPDDFKLVANKIDSINSKTLDLICPS